MHWSVRDTVLFLIFRLLFLAGTMLLFMTGTFDATSITNISAALAQIGSIF